MSEIECFLARLYTDERLRQAFTDNPNATLVREGVSLETQKAFEHMDIQGLKMAGQSIAHKRASYGRKRLSLFNWIFEEVGRRWQRKKS